MVITEFRARFQPEVSNHCPSPLPVRHQLISDPLTDGQRCSGSGGRGIADVENPAVVENQEIVKKLAVESECLCPHTRRSNLEMLCPDIGNQLLQCFYERRLGE